MAGYALNESNFIDSIKGITEIKTMNWQSMFAGRNKIIYSGFQDRIYNLGKIKVKLNLISGFAGSVYLIAVLVCASLQVMSAGMTHGELMAVISLSSSLLPSALNLALISIPASEVKVAINRMFEFTQIEPESAGEEQTCKTVDINKIVLKDISFRFPGQKLLLEKIDLSVEKGRLVSLVGESGCGKSTLAGILLRFYLPESGEILINGGEKIRDLHINDWRARIAIIPQEIHIFNGTILENLIMDISESNAKELVTSITESGLGRFVDSFPSGLMTLVGEEGINLSGGQKQVLAFMRVLLVKPDILIIDEGTSNMDRETEALIMDLIGRLKSRMGILMISHRINMIKKLSDLIYVIEGRTITVKGTHDELIRSENLYSRFWKEFN